MNIYSPSYIYKQELKSGSGLEIELQLELEPGPMDCNGGWELWYFRGLIQRHSHSGSYILGVVCCMFVACELHIIASSGELRGSTISRYVHMYYYSILTHGGLSTFHCTRTQTQTPIRNQNHHHNHDCNPNAP